ncbi:CoA-acylating propionaldehyde dehydrogenase [Lachnospiraceae bacterium KM106-2]|nr:CoA-acylating propionaldehyde dehydrogenase [Lachnospiraceae bacterium KM106-2]
MRIGIFQTVNDAVLAARRAYERYSKLGINERQQIIEAIKARLRLEIPTIAKMTVEETGMGCIEDKKLKLQLAIDHTPGVEDLITEVKTGDHGMTLFELSSYGVICAIHPCTNPCATLINNTIGMLAAGNSVIHCPNPRAVKVSLYVTQLISEVIVSICGIDNLVVTLDESLMSLNHEVMHHPDVDMVVVTGGGSVLYEAMKSGKKVIGAGPANPVAIVDESADLEKAARDIVMGASFDHNVMCTSEKSIVIVSEVAETFIHELLRNQVYFVTDEEERKLLTNIAVTSDLKINRRYEGRSAIELLDAAGISCNQKIKLIVVETDKYHPFVNIELLMPIIPLIKVLDFSSALEIAKEIEQNYHHTAIIHSSSIDRLNEAAKSMQTAVFVKNGSSLAGIGLDGEGPTSFTIATATGEGTTSARHFTRRRRCTLTSGFSIR